MERENKFVKKKLITVAVAPGGIEIWDLEEPGAFTMVLRKDVPMDAACSDGRFVYIIKHIHVEAGHTKTDTHIANRRMLDFLSLANGPQEALGANAPPQHHGYRV